MPKRNPEKPSYYITYTNGRDTVDTSDLENIFVTFQTPVTLYAQRLLSGYGLGTVETDSVVSDTFFRLLRRMESTNPNFEPLKTASLGTFIMKITRNLVNDKKDFYDSRFKRGDISLALDSEKTRMLADTNPTPEESLMTSEKRREIKETLMQLKNPKQQAALYYADYLGGYSTQELANKLHLKEKKAFGTILQRARNNFKPMYLSTNESEREDLLRRNKRAKRHRVPNPNANITK